MPVTLKKRYHFVLFAAIAFTPWLLSMYTLYWLELNEVWVVETLHRDKMTVIILATGMALSFLLQSYFLKREKKTRNAN
ncbi:MAG: membrane protein DedA with SNARE-associated domain [Alcanivorax sp.]|jgi:membrane protein DedA with SNARE-associated domain